MRVRVGRVCLVTRAICSSHSPQLLELFSCNGSVPPNQNIVFNATTGRLTVPQVRAPRGWRRPLAVRPVYILSHPPAPRSRLRLPQWGYCIGTC